MYTHTCSSPPGERDLAATVKSLPGRVTAANDDCENQVHTGVACDLEPLNNARANFQQKCRSYTDSEFREPTPQSYANTPCAEYFGTF